MELFYQCKDLLAGRLRVRVVLREVAVSLGRKTFGSYITRLVLESLMASNPCGDSPEPLGPLPIRRLERSLVNRIAAGEVCHTLSLPALLPDILVPDHPPPRVGAQGNFGEFAGCWRHFDTRNCEGRWPETSTTSGQWLWHSRKP